MKKTAFEPTSEVQRALNRVRKMRVERVVAAPLYSLTKPDTLRNTSQDWSTHPEILSKSRGLMVAALRRFNLCDEQVLTAMATVPRHVFVDEAFYLRAYDDDALPIGFGQTISHPSVIARMLGLLKRAGALNRVLEIGTGCGYQAAVLAGCVSEVFSIERIASLYELATSNLAKMRGVSGSPQLRLGDGMLGWAEVAPFDGIIIAAAGFKVPQTLLEQLRIGGVLVAPVQVNEKRQCLVCITRVAPQEWRREILDEVRFVPLLKGVQN